MVEHEHIYQNEVEAYDEMIRKQPDLTGYIQEIRPKVRETRSAPELEHSRSRSQEVADIQSLRGYCDFRLEYMLRGTDRK